MEAKTLRSFFIHHSADGSGKQEGEAHDDDGAGVIVSEGDIVCVEVGPSNSV